MSDPSDRDDRDVLDEALGALRESTSSAEPSRAAETRRAILARASTTARRRRMLVVRLVLPIAAVLVASTAWAAATGRLPRMMDAIAEVFHPTTEPTTTTTTVESPTPSPTTAGRAPDASTASATSAVTIGFADSSRERSASPIDVKPSTTKPMAATAANPSSTPPPATTTTTGPIAAGDPEETLYRTAHEAHFTQRDWSKALTGWDAYLAAHPKGRFAPEARYNRALTLVRLGRRDEARAALQPFADGVTFAGYRQKEARALLDAME
jgi:hypothetical protein